MPNQQLPSILRSALARLNRRAQDVDPSSAPVAPTDGQDPVLVSDEPILVSDDDGRRTTEVPSSDILSQLPYWARRVTIPASFDPCQLDSVLSRLVVKPSVIELVLRRPPSEPIDLRPLMRFTQLETLTVESDWTYPAARGSRLRRSRRGLDLAPLSELSRLRKLTLRCESDVVDIEPLASLTELRELRLSGKISNLAPLRNLQHLQKLSLFTRVLKDIRPLSALRALTDLNLAWSKVSDLEPLRQSFLLNVLHLGSTRVRDVRPLADLARLEQLDLDHTRVTELAPLAGLNLRQLFLLGTRVADLRPLADCKLLEELCLADTLVTDVTPLARLPRLRNLSVARTSVRPSQLRALEIPNTSVDGLRVTPTTPTELCSARDFDEHLAQLPEPSADDWFEIPPHVVYAETADTCISHYSSDTPAIGPDTAAFLAAIVPGSTTRAEVEQNLGSPVHGCDQCLGRDVVYVFRGAISEDGLHSFLAFDIIYSPDGTVEDIWRRTIPATARQRQDVSRASLDGPWHSDGSAPTHHDGV